MAASNHVEALRCFRNALKFAPDTIVVLRDLVNLQTHVSD
jgi:hypothetical protein